jgi:anthranilate phosphoribosyltransferase
MDVTKDDKHDSEVLPSLIMDASRYRLISEAYMDGAYDSSKTYALLRKMRIKPSLSLEEMLGRIEALRRGEVQS